MLDGIFTIVPELTDPERMPVNPFCQFGQSFRNQVTDGLIHYVERLHKRPVIFNGDHSIFSRTVGISL